MFPTCLEDYNGPRSTQEEIENDPNHPFWSTTSAQLHLEAVREFGSLFGVPNEWLNPKFVDNRKSDDHTPVTLENGRIYVR